MYDAAVTKHRAANKCRLSLRERAFFRSFAERKTTIKDRLMLMWSDADILGRFGSGIVQGLATVVFSIRTDAVDLPSGVS